MFYQESKDLALCKKRKVRLLLDSLCDLRDMEIRKLIIQNPGYKSFDEFDNKLENILDSYRICGNSIIQYYYPDSKTMGLDDCANMQDE